MIRVGIGGWTYPPWRGEFYPRGWVQKRELEYASRHVTTIEINATFYRAATPKSFANWREQTPDDFVFAVKATRYATHRTVLADAADSIARFIGSGIQELGRKLGPILWQFPASKRFEPADFERFLALLPANLGSLRLRHALDVRHASFATSEFVTLAHRYGAAIVFNDSEKYPAIADVTSDFVYARLMRAQETQPAGYAAAALAAWARCARQWAGGGVPEDLPRAAPALFDARVARDVYIYFINGAKLRAPAAALALLAELGATKT